MIPDPLSDLRDIHTPPMPEGLSAWPIVAAVLLLLLLVALAAWLALRPRRRWAREAATKFRDIGATEPETMLLDAAKVLRQVAILRLGAAAGRLRGEDWLLALNRLFRTRFFSSGAGRIFGSELYDPTASAAPARSIVADLEGLARRRGWTPW